MIEKNKSPYTSITGCTFLYYEFGRILPLLMDANSEALLKDEIENNRVLQVNSIASRKRFVVEFKRRYDALPFLFWQSWQNMSEAGQRAGLLYAILKTYKLVFDFHFNVTLKKWNSIDHVLSKEKCCSSYLTILRQSGLLDGKNNELTPICLDADEFAYYFHSGEEWFLEACLLYPYEINDIKSKL